MNLPSFGDLAKKAEEALSQVTGMAGGLTGGIGAAMATKLTAATGINQGMIESMVKKAQEIMAEGKFTPDEVKQQLSVLALDVGVPPQYVDTAIAAVMTMVGKMGSAVQVAENTVAQITK